AGDAVRGAVERIRALRPHADPADPRAPAHQRPWRPGEPVLPRPAAGADRPRPPAREAAPEGARDGRPLSPRPDRASCLSGALPPFLAPRRHAQRNAAAVNEAPGRPQVV